MDGLAPAPTGPATGPQLDNRRVLAAVIDLACLVPVAVLMSVLFGGFTGGAALLTLAWGLYYYFALESDHGQTLGKRVMKIRVARADGSPLDTGRVAVRTLLRPIDAIGVYLVGLVVMLATGERRQRLGDLAAGTVVTEAGPSAASEPAQATPAPEVVAPEVAEPERPDAAPDPFTPLTEKSMGDTGIPAEQLPPPLRAFDPFAAPPAEEPATEPEAEDTATEPEAEVAVEPEPQPVADPDLPEIVPVDRPAEPAPPTDEPVPVVGPEPEPEPQPEAEPEPEPEPERAPLEIISSPIDLVMDQHQEEGNGEPEQDQPAAQPPADQA
ncbi:MAG: RDD family protein [Thermoleophilaceae bacterium]